jgi:hypothetical protein
MGKLSKKVAVPDSYQVTNKEPWVIEDEFIQSTQFALIHNVLQKDWFDKVPEVTVPGSSSTVLTSNDREKWLEKRKIMLQIFSSSR